MKFFIFAVMFAIILAAISAQESDESFKGSETLYLAAPYGAYGAYPYAAGPLVPAAAPIAAAPAAAAAYPYYYRR